MNFCATSDRIRQVVNSIIRRQLQEDAVDCSGYIVQVY